MTITKEIMINVLHMLMYDLSYQKENHPVQAENQIKALKAMEKVVEKYAESEEV